MTCHLSKARNLKISNFIYKFSSDYNRKSPTKMSFEGVAEETNILLDRARNIIPRLDYDKHKGLSGRIGVIGGSLEYTGAPYFSAVSALKVGADLVHVFCQRSAATVIKSYSPELIVHPLLDCDNAFYQIEPWLERLHVLVIGPGLGREKSVVETVTDLIRFCRNNHKPIVIDADGLHIITQNIELIRGYENAILTPNAIEFARLFGSDRDLIIDRIKELGDGVLVLEKGRTDKVYIPRLGEKIDLPAGGSARRCGGQGDLLSGGLATLYYWALQSQDPDPAFIATFAACYLTKQCNAYAFKKFGRSTVCSNMIDEIHNVFDKYFETK